MNFLLHGENILASRRVLVEKINLYRLQGKEIIRLDSKNSNFTEIKQACESNSLFGQEKIVVIENFYSLPKSKTKNEIIDYFRNLSSASLLIFWEKKALTVGQIKKLPSKTQLLLFKIQPVIFKFLDSFFPGNAKQCINLLYQCYQVEDEEMIFHMLCRQIRLLILAKELGGKGLLPMPFWMQNKFIGQSRWFNLDQLVSLYQNLLKIDYERKSGAGLMPLTFQLDLLTAKL